ncbi:MAG: colanic acid biosynthesis glycosyl transferase WcaI [Actinomycetota bacterium]|nr:colanic acid biosynthesis glycosyl transferase WcaI [Actinomycetota bacterium]
MSAPGHHSDGQVRELLRDAAVLVTTSCYAPQCTGAAPYVTDLAKALAREGARVRVITARPHPMGSEGPEGGRGRPGIRGGWTREVLDGVEVRRVPTYAPSSPTPLRAALGAFSFLPTAVREVRDARPDVVVACFPAVAPAVLGVAVARLRKAPWILLSQEDLAAGADRHTARGLPAGLVRWFCAEAAHVVLPCPRLGERLSAVVPRCPVSVVPAWSRPELLIPRDARGEEEDRRKWRELLDWRGRFVVAHTGGLGPGRGLEELLPVLEGLALSHPGVLFSLIGDGERRLALERAARRLPNLQVLPPARAEEYPLVLRAADVLLVHEGAGLVSARTPRKLASYLAAGRPVLAVVRAGSAAAAAVDGSGAGVVVPAGDARALGEALSILRSDPVLCERLGSAGRSHCERRLRPEIPLSRLTSLVAWALSGSRERGVEEGPARRRAGVRTVRLPDSPSVGEADREPR